MVAELFDREAGPTSTLPRSAAILYRTTRPRSAAILRAFRTSSALMTGMGSGFAATTATTRRSAFQINGPSIQTIQACCLGDGNGQNPVPSLAPVGPPGRTHRQHIARWCPEYQFPFANQVQSDPGCRKYKPAATRGGGDGGAGVKPWRHRFTYYVKVQGPSGHLRA